MQRGDVPGGLVKCDLSGDINAVVAKEATPDPNTSKSFQQSWKDAQAQGAKAGYFAIYSNSATNCSTVKSNETQLGAASYPFILNFVVQYKDEKTATDAYTNGTVFNFSATVLKQGGAPVIDGTKTGLTPNSVVLSASIPNQTFYIAEWQKKSFVVILVALNVDQNAGKKVATVENARIK
ncbi:MAG TPA: hypothetical protein VN973_03025 [Candidatus Dormibacteraeota bacterium]|nr:hypothetical protein [Candidatus Dormibacteraeota bacterium]